MPDYNPAVLRRMLLLRQCPLFAGADLDELATMAENVHGTTFPANTIVAPAGSRLPALHVVIAGCIETQGRRFGPRQAFGALEVGASHPLTSTAVATVHTETLELLATDFGEILEDNFGVMLAALRELAGQMLALRPDAPRGAPVPAITGPLGMVERLLVLRQLIPSASSRVQALAMLAHDSEEVRWRPGAVVVQAGQPATSGFVIVEGTLRGADEGPPHQLGPGNVIGHLETLAGVPHGRTLAAATEVRALRSPGGVILDILEDHTEVGLAIIAAFSSALLQAPLLTSVGATPSPSGTTVRR